MPTLQGSIEDIVFSSETCHRRETCQGEHEESQQTRQQWLTIPQAAYLAQAIARIVGTFQHRDDAKGAQVQERVAEQVEENSR